MNGVHGDTTEVDATAVGDAEAVVVHVIPTGDARGGQREARAVADRLDAPGVRRHVVLSLFAGPRHVPVDVALDLPGGDRPAVGMDPRVFRPLRNVLDGLAPATVVAHGGDPLKYLVPAMAGRRVPMAYYATGTFAKAQRPSSVWLWRALVRRPQVVACEGEEVLDECRRLLHVRADRLVLAPNGRDPAQFFPRIVPPPERGRSLTRGEPVLVFVGALTAGKRPDRFVEVVAAVRARGLSVRAVMCGDGPMAGALAAPAAAAGVELLGPRTDVAEILRGADCMVFPSLPTGEGMPGVLIEAGLSGLPVVASAVPGVRSMVDDGVTGFVVEPDDLSAMVDATSRLVTDDALRAAMGDAARRRCETHFSLDAVARCWWSFLEPLVTRGVSVQHARSERGGRRAPGVRAPRR